MKKIDLMSYGFLAFFLVLLFLASVINLGCGKTTEDGKENLEMDKVLYPAK